MSVIIKDFFQLGSMRLITIFIRSVRGLFIIVSLSPTALGEYTIWLLYIFYCSFVELGVSKGLERDLSHYRGLQDNESFHKISNTGWSTYFYLVMISSVFLAVISGLVFKSWVVAAFLATNLFADKLYRAYQANSRILFHYRTNGIAELIQVSIGFGLVYYCLPRYGILSIFPCFTVSLLIGAVYLSIYSHLRFHWILHIKESAHYIKTTLTLALMFYSIQLFIAISMTVVALVWDKKILGYYAFAFRVFQICIAVFPILIREVTRTRMYFNMAKSENNKAGLHDLMFPMSVYGALTTVFWLMVYWWSTFAIYRYLPQYKFSVTMLNILILSLLPLGISKIGSDYLCSRVHKKMIFVSGCWIGGVFLQIFGILMANQVFENITYAVPMVYLLSTIIIYLIVVGYSFHIEKKDKRNISPMSYLLMPLAVALMSVWAISEFMGGIPSLNIFDNIRFSVLSITVTSLFSVWAIWSQTKNNTNISSAGDAIPNRA